MSADATAPAPPRRQLLFVLIASVGFALIAMALCLPSMPSWTGAFGVSQSDVQLTFSAYAVALGLAQTIYGPLSDRHGRKFLLLVGFAVAAVGAVVAATATSIWALCAGRFIEGAGTAAGMVLGRAMVQDLYGGRDRARVMAYIGMAMGLCPPGALIVGGWLHETLGWRVGFWLVAVLAMTLLVAAALIVPADRRAHASEEHWLVNMLRAYATLLRVPVFRAYTGILAMCTGAFYVYLAGAPTVYHFYGVGPVAAGWLVAFVPLFYILGNFITTRSLNRVGEGTLMLAGQITVITGAAITLALGLAGIASPLAVALPLALLGLGHGLLMPGTLAGTVGVIPALAGAAAAAAGLAQQLFGAFGGYLVGFVSLDGARNLALLLMLFGCCALACQLYLRHHGEHV